MQRADVFKLIDGERDYQDGLQPDRTDGSDKTVGEYLVMLQYYVDEAVAAWTTTAGPDSALDMIRKCAGICVHCMEDHEAPPRFAE